MGCKSDECQLWQLGIVQVRVVNDRDTRTLYGFMGLSNAAFCEDTPMLRLFFRFACQPVPLSLLASSVSVPVCLLGFVVACRLGLLDRALAALEVGELTDQPNGVSAEAKSW